MASLNEGGKILGVFHVIYCTEAIWKATRNGRRRQTDQDPPGDREIGANIRKCLSLAFLPAEETTDCAEPFECIGSGTKRTNKRGERHAYQMLEGKKETWTI